MPAAKRRSSPNCAPETASLGSNAGMQIGPEQGAFMSLIVKLMGARRVIEFGTFTGYSSLAMALAGATRITCADVSKEFTDIARRFWAKAGVADRIELHLDGGNAVIARCLADGEAGTFDLAFIDADKSGYDAYYEGALKLLRPGGLVLVDNTLWGGDVADAGGKDADTSGPAGAQRQDSRRRPGGDLPRPDLRRPDHGAEEGQPPDGVIPAQAGIQLSFQWVGVQSWTPALTGVTVHPAGCGPVAAAAASPGLPLPGHSAIARPVN